MGIYRMPRKGRPYPNSVNRGKAGINSKADTLVSLAQTGDITPIGMQILTDMAYSFKKMNYAQNKYSEQDLTVEDFYQILMGAHCVIKGDGSSFFKKWLNWAKLGMDSSEIPNNHSIPDHHSEPAAPPPVVHEPTAPPPTVQKPAAPASEVSDKE